MSKENKYKAYLGVQVSDPGVSTSHISGTDFLGEYVVLVGEPGECGSRRRHKKRGSRDIQLDCDGVV